MDSKSKTPFSPAMWRRAVSDVVSTGVNKLPFSGMCAVLSGGFPSPAPPKEDLAELLVSGGADPVILVPTIDLNDTIDMQRLANSIAVSILKAELKPIVSILSIFIIFLQ
jgi:hypothetical protein